MRRRVLLGTLGAVIVSSGVFAATVIGGSDDKVKTGPRVTLEVKRISAADARASGANAPLERARAKKPRLNYFLATTPIVVPAGGATAIAALTCPSGQKVVSGFFRTDRLIAADHSFAVPPGTWEFGFFDVSGVQGVAQPGIVCAKGVKGPPA
jgi:hypothetical protein